MNILSLKERRKKGWNETCIGRYSQLRSTKHWHRHGTISENRVIELKVTTCIEHQTHLRAEILMLHRLSTVNSWRTTISIYSSIPSRTHFSDLVMHVSSHLNWMGTRYHLAQYNLLWNSTELLLNLVLSVWTFTSKAKWRKKKNHY
jgi:hypothetical protein